MKFLADQCTSKRTVKFLHSEGYTITTLEDLNQTTISDPDLLKLAMSRDEVLITEDKGFGNIMNYPPRSHQGIILLRVRLRNRDALHKTLSHFLLNTDRETLRHTLVTVTESTIRIRR